jgi:site-specific DNA-methyltransferase (adenine-specific)
MPPDLAERCILAGSKPGDIVLDPFAGAGTTLLVADRLQRDAIGIELNAAYAAMMRSRLTADCPLFAEVAD